jgi:hypothetical protein
MKVFFALTGSYDGLRGRRLRHSGRLMLYQIINDPYWLVVIKAFEPQGRDRALVAAGLAHPSKVGTWRYVALADAQAKFDQLKPFYPETKRIVSAATLEKLRRHQFKPKIAR